MTTKSPLHRVRTVAAGAAVAATVPYLTLKLLWLTGHPVGAGDTASMDDLWLVNLLTFGMDAVAVLLALAFVRPWGRRAPAGLLAFPMWVATGLLGTILVALPLILLSTLVLGPDASSDDDGPGGLSDWVFTVVYGGFAVQGVALIVGFLLYTRERWGSLLRERIGDLPDSPTLTLQRAFAGVAGLVALGVAAARFYWSAGGTVGLPAAWVQERGRSVAVMDLVTALMAVAATAALLVLVFRIRPERRLRVPLAVVWTAAGSLFGWGAWQLVAFGTVTDVSDPQKTVPGLLPLVEAAQVIAGLLVLAVGAIALVERAAARAAAVAPAGVGTAVAPAGPTAVPAAVADVESAR
ncbi:hypothetical protein RMN57_10585 [Kitasatospora sp. CM 4170]|uniref:LigA protein n=1 Tax=Kitasatospora aburaviensis TaxID=67265 RepID=A0ABW1EVM2_9ACTN|nr:hypothetical protein [Kitasatospora sp. CM 4170]WNM45130.1 hypothetical protein RMN57_10585 [Kitasatospora sp. CM 4170]